MSVRHADITTKSDVRVRQRACVAVVGWRSMRQEDWETASIASSLMGGNASGCAISGTFITEPLIPFPV